MALVERTDSKDYIGVYYTWNWELVSHFQTETFDLTDILWTSEDGYIVCWDTYIDYKLLIYSPNGNLLAKH